MQKQYILLIIVIIITIIINCVYVTNNKHIKNIKNDEGMYITVNSTKYPYYHTFWSGYTPFPWMNPTRNPYYYPTYRHNYYHNYGIPYYY
jgi:hypothetical protein